MTKYIQLTNNHRAMVDDADYDWLIQWKWFAVYHRNTWYAVRQQRVHNERGSRQITIRMHRQIMDAPPKTQIDHKDRNGLNNTRDNLRFCSNSQNHRNAKRQANNTSGYKGVGRDRNWYRARIVIGNKRLSLGYFRDAKDAAKAYDKAARQYFGEFALLNFPEER